MVLNLLEMVGAQVNSQGTNEIQLDGSLSIIDGAWSSLITDIDGIDASASSTVDYSYQIKDSLACGLNIKSSEENGPESLYFLMCHIYDWNNQEQLNIDPAAGGGYTGFDWETNTTFEFDPGAGTDYVY